MRVKPDGQAGWPVCEWGSAGLRSTGQLVCCFITRPLLYILSLLIYSYNLSISLFLFWSSEAISIICLWRDVRCWRRRRLRPENWPVMWLLLYCGLDRWAIVVTPPPLSPLPVVIQRRNETLKTARYSRWKRNIVPRPERSLASVNTSVEVSVEVSHRSLDISIRLFLEYLKGCLNYGVVYVIKQ